MLPSVAALPTASEREAQPPRRKPGKQPRGDWQMLVAIELYRIERNGEKAPTPAAMCVWCQNKRECNYHPDLREMQKLYRRFGV